MQQNECYRYLVIGRTGSGKSALCKSLTGDEGITISHSTKSGTKICTIHKSVDALNKQRGYSIEIIDTPGLDASDIDKIQSICKIIAALNQIKNINAVLYVIKLDQYRDHTIEWFFRFLFYLFTAQKISTSIIPILTHYDKQLDCNGQQLIETNSQAIQTNMKQRQEQTKKLFNKYNTKIEFWENRIKWANRVKWGGPQKTAAVQKIFNQNLSILVKKTKNITLQVKQKLETFQKAIKNKIFQQYKHLKKAPEIIKTKDINIPDLKCQIHVPKNGISWWHITPFVGWFIFLVRLVLNDSITQQQAVSNSKQKIFGQFLDKIHISIFLQQLQKRVTIRRCTPFSQKIFGYDKDGYIRLEILSNFCKSQKSQNYFQKTISQIKNIQVACIKPNPPQNCIIKNQKKYIDNLKKQLSIKCKSSCQKQQYCNSCNQIQIIVFQDKNKYKQEFRKYQFKNIIITRPCNDYYQKLLNSIIQVQ